MRTRKLSIGATLFFCLFLSYSRGALQSLSLYLDKTNFTRSPDGLLISLVTIWLLYEHRFRSGVSQRVDSVIKNWWSKDKRIYLPLNSFSAQWWQSPKSEIQWSGPCSNFIVHSPVPTAFWDSFNMAAFEEEISDGICIDCHAHISAKEFQKVKPSFSESILVKVENFNEKLRRFLLLLKGYRCGDSSGQSGKFIYL